MALTYLLAGLVSALLAIGAVPFAAYHFGVRRQAFRGALRQATSLALFAFGAAFLRFGWLVAVDLTKSPLAGLGFVLAPLYALTWGAVAFVVWWSIAVRWEAFRARGTGAQEAPLAITALSFGILVLALWVGAWEVRVRAKERYLTTASRSPAELEAAARDSFVRSEPDLLQALLAQPSLPAKAFLEVLEADPAALRQPPSSALWFMRWSPYIQERSVLERVAEQPALPEAVAEKLAADPSIEVVAAVARNPATPVAVVSGLVGRTEDEILAAVASHPGLGPMDLAKLAGHESISVRSSVAYHLNTPAEVLDALSADSTSHVRRGVAHNRNTALATLEKLATDPDAQVRGHVAAHPNAPATLVDRLAADPDEWVRLQVRWRRQRMSP